PYALIISPDKWSYLNLIGKDSGFIKHISESLHIKIVVSNNIKNAYLVPIDNENIEITLGQDFALGFQSYTSKEVELFVTSSFTFRVLDSSFVVVFK
ncbi:MAG: encapsulin, partial [Tannerellaceae bacterium]